MFCRVMQGDSFKLLSLLYDETQALSASPNNYRTNRRILITYGMNSVLLEVIPLLQLVATLTLSTERSLNCVL